MQTAKPARAAPRPRRIARGFRAFERRQQPLRLDERQAEVLGEILARVRAGRQLAQVGDRARALEREPIHGALEALRVRAEVERLEQRQQARRLGGGADLFRRPCRYSTRGVLGGTRVLLAYCGNLNELTQTGTNSRAPGRVKAACNCRSEGASFTMTNPARCRVRNPTAQCNV